MSLNKRFIERFVYQSDAVREALPEDAVICLRMQAQLLAELHGVEIDDDLVRYAVGSLIQTQIDSAATIWVLVRDGNVIGQVVTRVVPESPVGKRGLDVANLYVIPEVRLPGTSLALIRQVLQQALSVGAITVTAITVSPSLSRIYEQIGCEVEARVYALEVGL